MSSRVARSLYRDAVSETNKTPKRKKNYLLKLAEWRRKPGQDGAREGQGKNEGRLSAHFTVRQRQKPLVFFQTQQ